MVVKCMSEYLQVSRETAQGDIAAADGEFEAGHDEQAPHGRECPPAGSSLPLNP